MPEANKSSVAANQLPYDCFHGSNWEAKVLDRLQHASQESGIAGIYLLVAAPHGYEFQHLVVCRDEDDAEGVLWTNLTGQKQALPIRCRHDPAQSLECLRGIWQKRSVSPGTERDPSRGRNVTLFVVRQGQGAWLTCQTPLANPAEKDDLDALILDLQRMHVSRSEHSSEVPQ